MNKVNEFIFESYNFNVEAKTLELNYSFDGTMHFCEKYHFPFDFVDYSKQALDQACQLLFVMAGVSYYKAYAPSSVNFRTPILSSEDIAFFKTVYQMGLGEFYYKNNLDPNQTINFATEPIVPIQTPARAGEGLLVAIGGGKDSLLSFEILKKSHQKIATWSVGHATQLRPLIEKIGVKHYTIERAIDPRLLALNETGVYNGHIPISALFGSIGTILAILTGYRDVVVSN